MSPSSETKSGSDIVVVSATDDGYAMPLAVTIRSALDHLDPNRRLRLYVLDGGLSNASKASMLWSWNDPRITVEWVRPDMKQVCDLVVSDQVNAVTYLRLLMPHVLPKHVTRVIYIDADMFVRRDLGELWDEPQGEHAGARRALRRGAVHRRRGRAAAHPVRALQPIPRRLPADGELPRARSARRRPVPQRRAADRGSAPTGAASGSPSRC